MRVLNVVTTRTPFFNQQIASLEDQGVQTETVRVPGTARERSLRHYALFYKRILEKNPLDYDIIHSNYGLTTPFALAQPSRPVVVTLWGSDLMGPYGSLSKACAKRCDEVFVRSREMKEALGSDAHVVPGGVDFELFRPMPQEQALEAVSWSHEEKHVLFPYSRDRDVKNYPLAEEVVSAVEDRFEVPVNLQVVSDVSHDRIPIYMNAADALVLTSDREGSPNTIKEAMACNTPIVSTDVGDVRERLDGVTHSKVGRTKPELVDGLVSVLSSDARSNGRESIQDLRLDRIAKRIIRVYKQALT